MNTVGIIDCQIGNVGSLKNAFSYLGVTAEVVTEPNSLCAYDKIVLPGVGAFDTAMNALHQKGFIQPLKTFIQAGHSLLGICLGMQILCEQSEEGQMQGLGFIKGELKHLSHMGCQSKVPHVGFNSIKNIQEKGLFSVDLLDRDFYFIHSYALDGINTQGNLAFSEYNGVRFVAGLHYENILGMQFHPEKSGEFGLDLLQRFIAC